ncbi:hypothetical protein Syun_005673 [Stephania yunnanensis]|uniref:NAD-dependent epimerase/dehydratase domain-containing protein n=1 Tax=Stephania yunnanensis TaxID=152371 RepID=A0AAP0Q669_9MAGN
MDGKETACVTGAGGYQASWVVKLLLSHGYKVHGTVRDPSFRESELFKTDLQDFDGLCDAIVGCTGVFHVACPVPSSTPVQDPEPGYNWYSLAKTEAESLAFEYAAENGIDVVTVCPSLIIGPMLQPTMNYSSALLLSISRAKPQMHKLIKINQTDGLEKMEYFDLTVVDVRDVAEALLLVYLKPEAKGRYICSSYSASTPLLIEKLKSLYPNHKYPKQITGQGFVCKLSSDKLQKLGWTYRALEETLVDTIEDYYEKGLLEKP